MAEFSGIDPQALKGMISVFTSEKETLHGAYSSYFYRFGQHGLDTAPFTGLKGIAGWMDDQVPGLKRRFTLAVGLEHGGDLKHVVQVPEPVISTAAARKQAQALAKQLSSMTRLDDKSAGRYDSVAEQLKAHEDDPDYCSAFYGALKPPSLAANLPSMLSATSSTSAPDDLETFSKALGAASRAPYPDPDFAKVKKVFTTPVPKGVPTAAWDRMAMLHYGDFDAKFLAEATRDAALDQVAKDPGQDFNGPALEAGKFRLPQNAVALALSDLGTNGQAAFTALAQMGDPGNPDLQGNLDKLFKYAQGSSEVQSGLGKAIDAGAGVKGSVDKDGNWHAAPEKHDDFQSAFAFAVMIAAGNNSGKIDKDFNGTCKADLGRLAASYPQEMLSSGGALSNDVKDSTLGVPAEYTKIPGVDPSFVLSSADAYRFMKTFAGGDTFTQPYDEVMGDLQQTVLLKSAQADARAVREHLPDPNHYFEATDAFGTVQRLQYDAELKVRGDMDAADEANRELLKRALILGVEIPGEPEVRLSLALAWRAGLFVMKEPVGSSLVKHGRERGEDVRRENDEMIKQSSYIATSALLNGGWRTTTPLPDDLKDAHGKLKSFQALHKANQLDEFDDWVNEQRDGPDSLHQKQALASGLLNDSQIDAVADEVDEG